MQRMNEGSWLKETFVTPNEEWLNIYLDEAIQRAELVNEHARKENMPEKYSLRWFKEMKEIRYYGCIDYKQYGLLGYLYTSLDFQAWVRQREPVEAFVRFMENLHINSNVYTGGIRFDGEKFTPSHRTRIRDRQIYLFVQVMREWATLL